MQYVIHKIYRIDCILERCCTTYMPSDSTVGFNDSKIYNLQTKGILYLIESGIRPTNSSTAILGFNNYSLEHMMRRNNWSPCASDDLEKERDSKLLTLGNLAIPIFKFISKRCRLVY